MEFQAFYTPKQTATILQVRPETIYRWLADGTLPGTRLTRKSWRIPRKALKAYLRRNN